MFVKMGGLKLQEGTLMEDEKTAVDIAGVEKGVKYDSLIN